jgi:hypothetical protein
MGWIWTVQITSRDGVPRTVRVPNMNSLHGRLIWQGLKETILPCMTPLDREATAAIAKVDHFAHECSKDELFHSEGAKATGSLEALAHLMARVEDELHITVDDLLHKYSQP